MRKEAEKTARMMMEELIPELVALVLSQVDRVSLVACRFVCTTWMRTTTSPPRDSEQPPRQHAKQPQEDWSKQFAANGWLALLQWARANGCPWDKSTCAQAARGGHLDVLQWAFTNGCPWGEETCVWAAERGHLEVLQWARTNGCPWDKLACVNAAKGGHLDVLQWARANGCPWDKRTCMSAAWAGHLEVLQWARANGCPGTSGRVCRRPRPSRRAPVGRGQWLSVEEDTETHLGQRVRGAIGCEEQQCVCLL
jgi:hypothetical protein